MSALLQNKFLNYQTCWLRINTVSKKTSLSKLSLHFALIPLPLLTHITVYQEEPLQFLNMSTTEACDAPGGVYTTGA
jgi:hypothetical protein